MALFRDDTAIAERLIPKLEEEFARARPAMQRARSKLFALIPPPEAMDAGQDYDVDTRARRFAVKVDEVETASGPLAVIGTYTPSDGSWVWGWENPSVPAEATQEIAALAKTTPELELIRQCVKFQASEEFCERLSQWIAVKGGWMGAYPARFQDTIVFVAVKPSLHDEAGEPADTLWCSLCGTPSTRVRKLITGRHFDGASMITSGNSPAAICNNCVDRMLYIPGTDEDLAPACLMCGGTEGARVCTDYAAVCERCMRTMGQIVDAQ